MVNVIIIVILIERWGMNEGTGWLRMTTLPGIATSNKGWSWLCLCQHIRELIVLIYVFMCIGVYVCMYVYVCEW